MVPINTGHAIVDNHRIIRSIMQHILKEYGEELQYETPKFFFLWSHRLFLLEDEELLSHPSILHADHWYTSI